jgi:GDSL-like Lipase/Acylhydrolase family
MKRTGTIRSLLILLSLLLALASQSARSAAASPPTFNPPKQYYLALGDSLAFGFQLNKYLAEQPNVDPASFNTGYVDDFATLLAKVRPGIQIVNYACSGETTATYLHGGCQHPELRHIFYDGSQEAAALQFISDHPGQVSPITLDIGADDLLQTCGSFANVPCLSVEVPMVLANLGTILSDLRRAAPYSEIIVMLYYNPYAVVDPSSNALVESLDGLIASVAGQQRARVANAFAAFNLAPPDNLTLCDLTLYCTSLQDIHASDTGYGVIAQQFLAASGYDRLGS